MRLVKNYDGRGLLLRKGQVDDYTLEGTDGGVDEIRRIVFEAGKLPKVLSFIDRTAATHMEPKSLGAECRLAHGIDVSGYPQRQSA